MKRFFSIKTLANILSGALGMSLLLGYIYYINPPMPKGTITVPQNAYQDYVENQIQMATGVQVDFIIHPEVGPDFDYSISEDANIALLQCGIDARYIQVSRRTVKFLDDGIQDTCLPPNQIVLVRMEWNWKPEGNFTNNFWFETYEVIK